MQQARVVATVAQDFESDEDVSDGEGDGVTLFSSAGQLPPSGQADADTLPVMPQEHLDAVSEEMCGCARSQLPRYWASLRSCLLLHDV